ncbi:MAG TPA: zf-TFIIB domain-containing protein [Nitrospiria bacterium]|nr:zf-TFIIB domain-containing protein [Nitrospiria bacterium]
MSDLQEKGYNKEEEYFYRQNKELLEKRRKELDAQRRQQESQQRHAHWMKCPKCGADMREIERQGIKVDQCGGCGGIYFDRGELELLMEAKEQKGFLGGLKTLFNK